jgi:hypothetical protein
MLEEAERAALSETETTVEDRVARGDSYIDTTGTEVALEESKKKTYMTKDPKGQVQLKSR